MSTEIRPLPVSRNVFRRHTARQHPARWLARSRRFATLAVAVVIATGSAAAAQSATEVKVAVAANFTAAAKQIAAAYEKASGAKVALSFGSTGHLYTQITQGAPFEVFLAADQARPKKAQDEGHAVPGSRFTYAVGKLVLFSKSKDLVQGEATLESPRFAKIAIANPATAPYGAAAIATMKALGVHEKLASRIVQGNNIAQTFQFVDTGNAELGFIALSQIDKVDGGSRWLVPATFHNPIAQDAVLLKAGANSEAARGFLAFLRGPEARAFVETYGYGVGD